MKRDLVVLLVLTACLTMSLNPWADLMRRWRPTANSSYYRFDLPGPDRLQVALLKHGGGVHNRRWEIQIMQRASEQMSPPWQLDNFSEFGKYPGQNPQHCLARREFVGATDRIFDPQPGIWVRSIGDTWSFLSYQGISDASWGPIEVVPRSQFQPGDAVEFGEGYFTWHPGMPDWVAK